MRLSRRARSALARVVAVAAGAPGLASVMTPVCAMLHPVGGQSVQGAAAWRVHARAMDVASGAEVALFSALNAHAEAAPDEFPPGARVVVSGGWLDSAARPADTSNGDDAPDAMRPTWTSGPRTRVQGFFERAAAVAGAAVAGGAAGAAAGGTGARVLVRPRAGDVVSDIPSTLALLRALPGVGLALEPSALIPERFLRSAPDLLARVLDAFGAHPALELVVLSTPVVGRAGLELCPVTHPEAAIDAALLAPFARLGKPILLYTDARADARRAEGATAAVQLARLGVGGG